jgi:hypothetical protein
MPFAHMQESSASTFTNGRTISTADKSTRLRGARNAVFEVPPSHCRRERPSEKPRFTIGARQINKFMPIES